MFSFVEHLPILFSSECIDVGCVNRAINYDEKDPFLCNACGYCKYAKFDFTVTSRPCCAVDPIENEDDRKKVYLQMSCVLQMLRTVGLDSVLGF